MIDKIAFGVAGLILYGCLLLLLFKSMVSNHSLMRFVRLILGTVVVWAGAMLWFDSSGRLIRAQINPSFSASPFYDLTIPIAFIFALVISILPAKALLKHDKLTSLGSILFICSLTPLIAILLGSVMHGGFSFLIDLDTDSESKSNEYFGGSPGVGFLLFTVLFTAGIPAAIKLTAPYIHKILNSEVINIKPEEAKDELSPESDELDSSVNTDGSTPTLLLSSSEMVSESLSPLELPVSSNTPPRQALASVVSQIEQTVQASAAPPRIRCVRVRTVSTRTLKADEVTKGIAKEFYSLALEYNGKFSRVISVLKISDFGNTASVVLQSKEVISPTKNFLPWFFTAFFVGNNREDVPEDERAKSTWGTVLGMLFCLMVGGYLGAMVFGHFVGSIIGFIVLGVGFLTIGHSLNTRRTREVDELLVVAKFNMMNAYNSAYTVAESSSPNRSAGPSNIRQEQPDRFD